MARKNSFYLPPAQWPSRSGDKVLLDGAEAKHMVKVLRTRLGETVRLFDGAGHEGDFILLEATKSKAVLETVEVVSYDQRQSGLWLALGWNKSSRRGFLLEKAVELQAAGIIFWQAEFSQGKLPAETKESWEDKCVQAAKQCGNPWLPELGVVPGGVNGVVDYGKGFDRIILAWENQTGALLSPQDFETGKNLVVIGPEGGFAWHEAQYFMEHGFEAMSLGNSILRWETAAMYCLSLSFYAREAVSL